MANNLDAFIPELWTDNLIQNIDQVNVALSFVNRTYQDQLLRAGDTVHVQTLDNIIVGDYERYQTISTQRPVPKDETLVVDKADYFSVDFDNLDDAQTMLSASPLYIRRGAVAMSNRIDSFIFDAYSQAWSANNISNGGSAIDISPNTATTAVYELLVDANKRLTEQNVDRAGRWIVVTPYVESLLLKSTTYFIRSSELGDSLVTNGRFPGGMAATGVPGFIGRIAGFDVYTSNNLPKSGSNYYLIYGQDSPISYVAQIAPGNAKIHDLENTFGYRVKALMLHGKKVFSEDSKRLGTILVDNA